MSAPLGSRGGILSDFGVGMAAALGGQPMRRFNPEKVYRAAQKGLWADPSDLGLAWQESAAITAAAVGQPVGYVADKRTGAGRGEMIPNGTFDTDISGWGIAPAFPATAVTWSSGALKVQSLGTYGEAVGPKMALTVGRTYRLQLEVLAGSDGGYYILISNSATSDATSRITVTSGTAAAGYQKWDYTFTATYADAWLYLATKNLNGAVLLTDNISVNCALGNNLAQTTATARPVLTQDGLISYWLFDGIDDALAGTFPAGTFSSQTDCFVAVRRDTAPASSVIFAATAGAGNQYFGVMQAGSSSSASGPAGGAGSPTYAVNGIDVPGGTAVTRDQMNAAVPVGRWSVVEARNLDLSAWAGLNVCGYGGGSQFAGAIAGIVIAPAQPARREQIRHSLGLKAGLLL